MCSLAHPLTHPLPVVPDATVVTRRDVLVNVAISDQSTQPYAQAAAAVQFSNTELRVHSMSETEDITALLQRAQNGDRSAESRLLEVLYAELRRIAGMCIRSERQEHTLQATALVNEAYLRLAAGRDNDWQNRKHFLAAAAQVMHRVLVDCARARNAQKRGGKWARVELDSAFPASADWARELLDIDAALARLAKLDERQARVVELRFFAGLTETEVAEVLGVSDRTVKREWEFARAWLHGQLTRSRSKASGE